MKQLDDFEPSLAGVAFTPTLVATHDPEEDSVFFQPTENTETYLFDMPNGWGLWVDVRHHSGWNVKVEAYIYTWRPFDDMVSHGCFFSHDYIPGGKPWFRTDLNVTQLIDMLKDVEAFPYRSLQERLAD